MRYQPPTSTISTTSNVSPTAAMETATITTHTISTEPMQSSQYTQPLPAPKDWLSSQLDAVTVVPDVQSVYPVQFDFFGAEEERNYEPAGAVNVGGSDRRLRKRKKRVDYSESTCSSLSFSTISETEFMDIHDMEEKQRPQDQDDDVDSSNGEHSEEDEKLQEMDHEQRSQETAGNESMVGSFDENGILDISNSDNDNAATSSSNEPESAEDDNIIGPSRLSTSSTTTTRKRRSSESTAHDNDTIQSRSRSTSSTSIRRNRKSSESIRNGNNVKRTSRLFSFTKRNKSTEAVSGNIDSSPSTTGQSHASGSDNNHNNGNNNSNGNTHNNGNRRTSSHSRPTQLSGRKRRYEELERLHNHGTGSRRSRSVSRKRSDKIERAQSVAQATDAKDNNLNGDESHSGLIDDVGSNQNGNVSTQSTLGTDNSSSTISRRGQSHNSSSSNASDAASVSTTKSESSTIAVHPASSVRSYSNSYLSQWPKDPNWRMQQSNDTFFSFLQENNAKRDYTVNRYSDGRSRGSPVSNVRISSIQAVRKSAPSSLPLFPGVVTSVEVEKMNSILPYRRIYQSRYHPYHRKLLRPIILNDTPSGLFGRNGSVNSSGYGPMIGNLYQNSLMKDSNGGTHYHLHF